MSAFFLGVLWYFFLGVIAIWLQFLTRCFTQLNLITVVFSFFFLRHGITVPFDHDINMSFAGIEVRQESMFRFYSGLVLMYIFMLLGLQVGHKFWGSCVINIHQFQIEMRKTLSIGLNQGALILVSLVVAILIVLFQIKSDINIWDFLSGNLTADQYKLNRDVSGEATRFSLGPIYRLASIARFGFLPLLVALLFLLRKKSKIFDLLFWVLSAIGIIAGLLSGQKTPAVFILITIGLAAYLRRGDIRIQKLRNPVLLAGAIMLFAGFPFLYGIQYPELSYVDRLNLTVYRVSSEYDRSLQLYFEIYPDIHEHMRGLSSPLISSIVGNVKVEMEPDRFIATYYLGDDYLNTWNAAFIGQAWVDWGYWGVALVSFNLGLMLQGFGVWFSRSHKTALVLGTQVSLMVASTRLSEVGYTTVLLNYGLLSGFMLSFILKIKYQLN